MKAILIDPQGKPPVSEIEVENELEPLQKMVGGYLEAHRLGGGDVLLVDEEWTMKANPNFKGKFTLGRFTFGGRGLIVGSKGDNFTAPKLNLLAASSLVNIHIS